MKEKNSPVSVGENRKSASAPDLRRHVGAFSVAVSFAGCFLGAGFVSGQEIYQFFGRFAWSGIWGMALSFLLFFLLGVMLVLLPGMAGTGDMGRLMIRREIPFLRGVVGVFMTLFIFLTQVIMSAGIGSLMHFVFGIPTFAGSLLFVLLIATLAVSGIRGLLRAFSVSVPLLCVFAFLTVVLAHGILSPEAYTTTEVPAESAALVQNFWLSGALYTGSNLMPSIGVLAPVGQHLRRRSSAVIGVLAGSLLLFLLAAPIAGIFLRFPAFAAFDMPMLEVARAISPVLYGIYALLLCAGMTGTALSSLVSIEEYLVPKFSWFCRFRIPLVFGISLCGFAVSQMGFRRLVSTVYPVCGYVGILLLILAASHFLHCIRINKGIL